MIRELYSIAAGKRVEQIIVKFMKPQAGAGKIVKRLGFHRDAVVHDYVKDIKGVKHDLILMRCDLESLWQKLEHFIVESDWQRTR